MNGAMFGDFVGSIYEWDNIKTKDFLFTTPDCFLTDDSYMTLAVASACVNWPKHHDLDRFSSDVMQEMLRIGRKYPGKGYGGRFSRWLQSNDPQPYGSYGNGSAMRVSPCGFIARSLAEAEDLAEYSAYPTHDHREGVKGAKATAAAVYMACNHATKEEIADYIRNNYYPLDKTLDEIRPTYTFDDTCQGTVPPAIQAFLESTGFEDAIRNAISLGGDSDTLAAITGGIAEAFYGITHQQYKPLCFAQVASFGRDNAIIRKFYDTCYEVHTGRKAPQRRVSSTPPGKVLRKKKPAAPETH